MNVYKHGCDVTLSFSCFMKGIDDFFFVFTWPNLNTRGAERILERYAMHTISNSPSSPLLQVIYLLNIYFFNY